METNAKRFGLGWFGSEFKLIQCTAVRKTVMRVSKSINVSGLKENIVTRFWSHVDKGSDCWVWKLFKNKSGYGFFKYNRKQHAAHRIAYAIFYHEDPGEMIVCHRCDNPSCVNPKHLYAGTYLDNALDREDRGRSNRGRGSNSHKAKLTETQVLDARQMYADGLINQKQLSIQYGVSKQTMNDILQGKVYCLVGGPTSRRNARNDGSRNPRAKLQERDVAWIRKLRNEGYTDTDLARKFNVSKSTINGIVLFRTWKNVECLMG